MNNLQDQGRVYYKRGEYEKAIDLFDRAIGRSPSVQVLDNRAACYEKLNDYSAALKDAKKAIQLHREDALGYLRAGRLLVKMEKQSVALEIYTHGLKCIKHVGQGYERLRKVHKELMDELCPPKSVDPLTVLPRELAETIVEYLSFRQRMNACLVSKPWAQFIRSTPNLWRHLDLSGARRKVRSAFVSRAINVARTKLKAATLSNLYDFNKTLRALVRHCPLEELTLRECGLQSQNLTTILEAAKNLRALKIADATYLSSHELLTLLAAVSETLETAECHLSSRSPYGRYHAHCPMLTSLVLTFHDGFDHSHFFERIADYYPMLQRLIVCQDKVSYQGFPVALSECEQLRHFGFHVKLHGFLQLQVPLGLTALELGCLVAPSMISELPMLEMLGIEGRSRYADVVQMLNKSTTPESGGSVQEPESVEPSLLRKLTITEANCNDSNDMEMLISHPRLKALESLCLARSSGIDDDSAAMIASAKLDKLRSIDLAATDLTGIGVKVLVSSLNLDAMILNECRNVSSDAVDWARSKGIAVKYRMSSSTSASGRKVRN